MQGSRNKQTGLSFSGFIMGAFVLILVVLLGMKTVPAYLHSKQISQVFQEIVADPALRDATEPEIEMAYRKRAGVNDITDLKAEDVTIERDEGGTLSLSAEYEVRIPLFGNVTLLLAFKPSSS
jgi:predicted lipid carrier protein YhbT